jgi:type VI secretion system protein ImpH
LIAKLAAEPFAFDFYAALRLVQNHFANHPRIGYSWSASQDPVRLAQSPSLDFASSTLHRSEELERALEGVRQKRKEISRPPVLYSRHFGVFGPNGPLPLCLTEYARDRVLHHGDPTFAAFCNIFHHRLLSFFFRAWADAQKTVDFDRPKEQCWEDFVGSLIGIGMESLRQRNSVPDRAKFYFAGRLVQQTRNAEGLGAIVQDFFGVTTKVLTFVGRWLALPRGSVCRLGQSRATGTLGAAIIVGNRFWTCQLHFRLRLGPMKLDEYERLLPSGASFRRLCDWVREYAGEHYSWDAQLVLAKEEVPNVRIGRAGRLGWTTWLKTRPFERDAENLVLVPAQQ